MHGYKALIAGVACLNWGKSNHDFGPRGTCTMCKKGIHKEENEYLEEEGDLQHTVGTESEWKKAYQWFKALTQKKKCMNQAMHGSCITLLL